MKKLVLIASFISSLFFSQVSFSQSISTQVISNSGENFRGENISLNWTLGESVNDVLGSEPYIHTQGFHQTYLESTNVSDDIFQSSISVYPNPVNDFVNIKVQNAKGNVVLELHDLSGKKLHSERMDSAENFKLDMRKYATGKYLLHIISDSRAIYSIIKSSK